MEEEPPAYNRVRCPHCEREHFAQSQEATDKIAMLEARIQGMIKFLRTRSFTLKPEL